MSGLSATLRALEQVVGGTHLLTAADAVAGYQVAAQRPLAVALPGSAEEVAEVLRAAAEATLSVVLRGAGHHQHLGAPPQPIGLVVSMERLNQVVEYDAEDVTVTAQAGMSLGALNRLVGERGQMLPLDPPGPATATLGGIASANLAGPLRMRHGSPRDLVLGLRVALASGEVIKTGGRTVTNVAGYDLGKLFIGALGTVGAIVEVTVRLAPVPETRAILSSALPPAQAAAAAAHLVGSGLDVAACEVVNHAGAERLGSLLPVTASENTQVLLVELLGEPEAIERQVTEIGSLLETDCVRLEGAEAEAVWESVRFLAYPARPGAMLVKAAVPLSRVPDVLAAVSAHEGWAAAAHAGDGIVYASTRSADGEGREVLSRLRLQAERRGGFVVLESGPAELKREASAWGRAANADLMRELKGAFDPEGVLGCGRFALEG